MEIRYGLARLIRLTGLLAGLAVWAFSGIVQAGVPAACDTRGQQRPAIGLALSGGGARGAAHIGVIKVLEELKIPIDCIAGTSMGSVIGGLYASGMSVEDLERAIAEIDWDGVFKDEPERADRTFRRKQDDLLFLVKKKARIRDGEISPGEALIQGQKFDLVLSELTLPVHGIEDFDRLRIPFRAVATDITTGDEVVLGEGSLARALRASMAVPAAFAAVEIEDRLLVDGGIANNLPISVVREMGADIVIAVDISTPLLTRDQLDSALTVLDQLSGLLTRRNTELQLASLTERDVLLVPQLGEIGSGDFDLVQEAVPTGETAAREARKSLARYSVSDAVFEDYLVNHPDHGSHTDRPVVAFVRIHNDSRVSDETVARHLDYPAGTPLDTDSLDAAIGRVYGMDIFESVRYRVVEEDGRTGVVIDAREKSWGTDSLQLGIELSADLDGDSFFNIGGAYTKVPLNDLNGEWRTLFAVGEEPALVTEIYQPLDPAERWFINPGVGIESKNVKTYDDGRAVAEYNLDQLGITLAGGYNIANKGRLQLEWRRFEGEAEVNTGSLKDFDYSIGELRLGAAYDTLDSIYFPRKGLFGAAVWVASRDSLGADDGFDQYLLRIGGAHSWGDHTLLGSVRFDTTPDDDAPVQSRFRTGGFLNLSGLQQNELSGQHVGSLLGGYMYRMTDKLVPTYVGASFEVGNAWEESDDVGLDDTLLAGSVFVGADTILGPLYVAYGHAEGGDNAVYVFLGQPWFDR